MKSSEGLPINRFLAEGVSQTEDSSPAPGIVPGKIPGNTLYRVLALYLPWSILVSFPPPALALLRLLPGISLPGPAALALAVYIPAIFASAAVTLYLEFLDPRTGHSGAHIRGAVLACAAAYLLSSILSALSARPPFNLSAVTRCFFPSLRSVAAVLAALYLWVFVIYLRDLFRARELFESHTRRFRGEDLRRAMLEDSAIMSAAETRGISAARHYGIQLGLAFILVLLCGFLKAPLSLFQHILTIAILAGAALIFALLSLFRQEQFFAGEGIAVPGPERSKRIGAGILFCAAAALLAVLCAGSSSLLPLSLITAFFAWLAGLLRRPGQPVEIVIQPPPQETMGPDPRAMLQFLETGQTEPWPFWDYLPYIALAALIAVFLWFMVKPLFGLNRGGRVPFILRLGRLIRDGFASLRRRLRNFFSSLQRGGAGIKISEEKLKDLTEDLLAGWSRARKRELRQSLSLFARLILWGNQRYNLAWKPSMGPGEYCARLARNVEDSGPSEILAGGSLPPRPSPAVLAFPPPQGQQRKTNAAPVPAREQDSSRPPRRPPNPPTEEAPRAAGPETAGDTSAVFLRSAEILRCGEIFEEALYGPRLPDKKTQEEFRRLVETITG
jgi:hypothetical protein